MEINVVQHTDEKVKVTIACLRVDDRIQKLKKHIALFDERIQGKKEKEVAFVEISQVLYFEVVDNRTFLYTQDDVMEVEAKLYELEMTLPEGEFVRSSKSQMLNLNKVKSLRPELNRTIQVTMCNEEKLYISRKYAPGIKKLLGI